MYHLHPLVRRGRQSVVVQQRSTMTYVEAFDFAGEDSSWVAEADIPPHVRAPPPRHSR